MEIIEKVEKLLDECTEEERQEIFRRLREKFMIHPLEGKYGVKAEVILEAIDRASDLTQRGIKGIIAEAFVKTEIIERSVKWEDITPPGDWPFDFLLQDENGQVRIQVKMQRREKGEPMMAKGRYHTTNVDMYVVETQKTRGGKDSSGQNTRPYRFGEFDVLAVSMQPSSRDWSLFRYTVANWLLPRPEDATQVQVFQPVPTEPNSEWTDDFETAVRWFRSGEKKVIST